MSERAVRAHDNRERRLMTPDTKMFFREQERRNQRLMAYAKFGVIAAILLLDIIGFESWKELGYSMAESAMFLPVAFMQLWLSYQRFYWPILKYLFLTIDIAVLTYIVMVISPFTEYAGTAAEKLELISFYNEQDLQILNLFLAWVLLAFSIRFVVWFALNASMAWIVHFAYVRSIPGTFDEETIPAALKNLSKFELRQQPLFINADIAGWNIELMLVLAVGLSFVIYNSRSLVMKFYKSQVQRNILSRYFSPSVVDRLIEEGAESLPRQKIDAAVLFVDIVGFTPLCERISPDELLTMLQEFHAMLEELVFEHGGNMEKYIGDALMASFGVPEPHEDSALQAYNCARDMLDKVATWSAERAANGQEPISIGIGLSYGETITGTIGQGRNMAFVVVGQTVNMASRLQNLTRSHDTALVVNEAFYDKIEPHLKTGGKTGEFAILPPVKVKGFSDPVKIRVLQSRTQNS